MKKNFMILMMLIIMSTLSIDVCARELNTTFISYGITEEGINYQVYGETLSVTESSISVTRTIVFEGNVNPSFSLPWSENIDGINYSGTLYIVSMNYNKTTNKTTALYQGTLYKN